MAWMLKKLNIVKVVEREEKKDALLAQGYEEYAETAGEAAAVTRSAVKKEKPAGKDEGQ